MGERGGVALLELVEGVVHGRGDGIPQNADTGSFERGQERKKNPVKAAEPSGNHSCPTRSPCKKMDGRATIV
jgi:hypothetical protein